MANVKLDDSILHNIADKIREKNKETSTYYPSEMPDAIERIVVTEPVIEQLDITANGTYTAPEGVHGYSPINVNVQPELEELTATDNGEYLPTAYGYSKVTVDVQPELEDITITTNGTYNSDKYGYGEVIVECPPAPTDEELTLTGDCTFRFAHDGWNWFVEKYGDRITTKDINNLPDMFNYCDDLTEIPFQFNITNATSLARAFNGCKSITTCPKIRGTIKWSTSTTFESLLDECRNLRDVEDLFTGDMLDGFSTVKVTSSHSCPKPSTFESCYSLRTIPSWWYKFKLNEESTAFSNYSYTPYYRGFYECYALDEITNIPVWKCQKAQTSNMFGYAFSYCQRVKNITFETNEDGTAIETLGRAQTIDLTQRVGYANIAGDSLDYNSGITADKQVKDDASYQALKNDPDWFTTNIAYSRYNHDSAVATINSLPDTSAYLATAGGTNTIKFKGASGELTDGGAINTLTEEEIAVATAKGWTVTLS